LASAAWTSEENRSTRFSLTIPSDWISAASRSRTQTTYSSEESEDVLDEVSLVVVELVVPVVKIGGKVDLLGSPEPDSQYASRR
jgi:hypothetical protein